MSTFLVLGFTVFTFFLIWAVSYVCRTDQSVTDKPNPENHEFDQ